MRLRRSGSWIFLGVRGWPPIFIHLSFPVVALLITWPLWSAFRQRDIVAAAIVMVGLMLSVLLHEFAHAEAGRRLGLAVGPIRLHGDGGDVAVADDDRRPGAVQLMLAAGPASNLMLALLCIALLHLHAAMPAPVRQPVPVIGPDGSLQFTFPLPVRPSWRLVPTVLTWLGAANLWLAIYNLLPLERHDGWQILKIRRDARRRRQARDAWNALKDKHRREED